LRQKRGRHLHETHATAHNASREACQVADDAAAKRNNDIAALQARGRTASTTSCNAAKLLVFSPGGNTTGVGSIPPAFNPSTSRARWIAATLRSVTTAARTFGARLAISAPARSTNPDPINMS
jgi:hypothetical protein